MTPEKVLEAVAIYRAFFEEHGVPKIDYPHGQILADGKRGPAHCHHMLEKLEEFVRAGRMEKAFRWLGFIQGVLWAYGLYTLTDLKNHNRPL